MDFEDFLDSENLNFNLYQEQLNDLLESEQNYDIDDIINNFDELFESEINYDSGNIINASDIVVQKNRKIPGIKSEDGWIDITGNDDVPQRLDFTVAPKIVGPQVSSSVVEPLHFFKLFFTDQLVDEIVKETNNFAETRLRSKQDSTWRDVERNEFWAFIGVILNMGTMPLANMQEYWSTKQNSRIPFFSDIFTRSRFDQIFWMFHLKTPNPASQNINTGIQKASTFLEYINSKFSEHFVPGRNICVGESVLKCKERISLTTYNANKPTNWGTRIYVLADSETDYVYSILPYYDGITSKNLIRPDLSVSTRIPLHLYQNLLNQIPTAEGYHMYTNSCYTSISLAEELMRMKCHLTGTVQANDESVPNSMKKPKFLTRNTVAYRKRNVMLLAWKDKRVVTVLSTWDHAGITSTKRFVQGGADIIVKKPSVVLNYISFMGGVNRTDPYKPTYCFLGKSLKWWRKMFFWGLEICAMNSYVLYKTVKKTKNENPLTHLKFVKLLVDQLVGTFRQERGRASSSTSTERLNGKLHVMRKGTKRDCVVCSKREPKSERRQTKDYCDTCTNKPKMHMGDCFYRYHTMEKFKIKNETLM